MCPNKSWPEIGWFQKKESDPNIGQLALLIPTYIIHFRSLVASPSYRQAPSQQTWAQFRARSWWPHDRHLARKTVGPVKHQPFFETTHHNSWQIYIRRKIHHSAWMLTKWYKMPMKDPPKQRSLRGKEHLQVSHGFPGFSQEIKLYSCPICFPGHFAFIPWEIQENDQENDQATMPKRSLYSENGVTARSRGKTSLAISSQENRSIFWPGENFTKCLEFIHYIPRSLGSLGYNLSNIIMWPWTDVIVHASGNRGHQVVCPWRRWSCARPRSTLWQCGYQSLTVKPWVTLSLPCSRSKLMITTRICSSLNAFKCHLIDFGLSMFLAETSMICSFSQFNPDWWLCFRCLILVCLKMDVSPF